MATTRFSIPEIDDSRDILDGPADINAALAAIDDSMTGYDSGTSLPAAGTAGKLFYRTDTGVLYFDNGTTWTAVAPDAAAGAYRTVHEVSLWANNTMGAGNYVALDNGSPAVVGLGAVTFRFCPITVTDHAVAGLSTKFRIQAATVTNTVAPAVNFTYSIASVATTAGSGGNLTFAIGSPLGSVTRSAPAASSGLIDAGSDFTLSSNLYVIVVTPSGTPASGSLTSMTVRLQVRNT